LNMHKVSKEKATEEEYAIQRRLDLREGQDNILMCWS